MRVIDDRLATDNLAEKVLEAAPEGLAQNDYSWRVAGGTVVQVECSVLPVQVREGIGPKFREEESYRGYPNLYGPRQTGPFRLQTVADREYPLT